MSVKLKSLLISFIIYFIINNPVYATIYYSWDSENQVCDSALPFYNEGGSPHTRCGSGAKQGTKYLEYSWAGSVHDGYTEFTGQGFPHTLVMGRTYYFAMWVYFERINGLDIWHEFSGQSYDKLIDVFYGSNVRFVIINGQHESGCANQNQDHHFTGFLFEGNRLNTSLPNYCIDYVHANVAPYQAKVSPLQLNYESWISYVLVVKMANDYTGSWQLYANGTKIIDNINVRTVSGTPAVAERINLNGTIAQPAYDAPPHKRRFDAILLTDNWQDIVNGGYMGGTTTILAPTNLRIISN